MKAVSFIIISVQIAFLLIILASVDVQSQTSSVNASDSAGIFIDYETVVAGKDYKIGGISEIILGEHWRQLWTKPFSVGVLDLGKYGGLKAYKTGGGLQTKSLHFRGMTAGVISSGLSTRIRELFSSRSFEFNCCRCFQRSDKLLASLLISDRFKTA